MHIFTEDPEAAAAKQAITAVGGLACQIDLAHRWQLSRQRVHELVREPAFPQPIGTVAGRPIWLALEADTWREYRHLCLSRAALNL